MTTAGTFLKSKGTSVWTVKPTQSVFEALQILSERNIGVVPVVENDELVGILSERDYARKVALFGRTSKDTPVSEIMTPEVETASSEDSIEDCMRVVVERGFRHLPILEDGILIGIISSTDLLAEVIRNREREIDKLENLITGSGEIT